MQKIKYYNKKCKMSKIFVKINNIKKQYIENIMK